MLGLSCGQGALSSLDPFVRGLHITTNEFFDWFDIASSHTSGLAYNPFSILNDLFVLWFFVSHTTLKCLVTHVTFCKVVHFCWRCSFLPNVPTYLENRLDTTIPCFTNDTYPLLVYRRCNISGPGSMYSISDYFQRLKMFYLDLHSISPTYHSPFYWKNTFLFLALQSDFDAPEYTLLALHSSL